MSDNAIRLVEQASDGDADAFSELCGELLSTNLDTQFASLEATRSAKSSDFWIHVIEFLAEPKWDDQELTDLKNDHFRRDHLVLKFTDLLERSPLHGGPIHADDVDHAVQTALKSENSTVRSLAARLAGDRKMTSCLHLIERLLKDSNPDVRQSAARAFGQLATHHELEPLAHALEDHDPAVRMRARNELIHAGGAAILVLVKELRSDHVLTRWEAVRALADMRSEEAISLLLEELHDSDSTVRRTAADGLSHLGQTGALAVLKELVHSGNEPNIRHEAAHAIRILSQEANLEALLKPVAESLAGIESESTAPVAAEAALAKFSEMAR